MNKVNVLNQAQGDGWALYHGDSCEVLKGIPDKSVGLSIFSPPFASLYTYSNSERDLGNCKSYDDFFTHFRFIAEELKRVLLPGRHAAIHCMDLPTTIQHHGVIGLQDFPGDIIRIFQAQGFTFHSRFCIWKDPVTAMQRTHSIGLLYKQLCKDSSISRTSVPDYVIVMRNDGKNEKLVPHEQYSKDSKDLSYYGGNGPENWQKWASPVWMDIDPSDTLQKDSIRDDKDERHICPLQLEVIRRCLVLWSNPQEIILSPFAGIGSEGYVSILNDRKFIGCELKESYYKQAVSNLKMAEDKKKEQFLF
jgi:DNA modification methylase